TPLELLKEDYPDCNEGVLNFPVVNIKEYLNYYFDLFNPQPLETVYDPNEFLLFHGFDEEDLTEGYHVSMLHIEQQFLVRQLRPLNDNFLCSIK
ncbi:MAG: hypothetical protein PHF25_04450, partial [Candidatus Margulisbacteria bacterium]|nr:hypothetical protein [Candidatus Margulisiibacteriota bacterium]